jgi:hypothetical protein
MMPFVCSKKHCAIFLLSDHWPLADMLMFGQAKLQNTDWISHYGNRCQANGGRPAPEWLKASSNFFRAGQGHSTVSRSPPFSPAEFQV